MLKKLSLCLAFVSVLIVFTGCQNNESTPTPIPVPTNTPAPTATPEPTQTPAPTAIPEPTKDPYVELNAAAYAANDRLGRGINLGNGLDGIREGAAGLYLQEQYFVDIADAGFDSVRVPVRFSAHTEISEPYEIDFYFLDRIDWVIEQAFANDLNVIIDVHHFEAIMQQPETQVDRLTAIWQQLGERYKDYPDSLYFELLNEPQDNLDSDTWNEIFPVVLEAVRETNPERYVIIGPEFWSNIDRLPTLDLPVDDRYLIATFHYYSPFEFTHQGASWAGTDNTEANTPWGSEADVNQLQAEFDTAYEWSQEQQRPLFLGEFGVYYAAPEESKLAWLAAVREEAEAREFSWSAWDFGTDFAIYNLPQKKWREPNLRALIPES